MQEFPVVWLESIVLASSFFSKPLLPWLLFPFFPAFEAPRDLSSSILHFILRSHTNGGVLFFNPSLLTAYSQKKEMVMSQGQVVQAQLAFVNKSLRKSSFLPMRELHCSSTNALCPSSHGWQTWKLLLTRLPRSKGKAFAGHKHQAAGSWTCALVWCRGPPCPAGRRSRPICSSARCKGGHGPQGTKPLGETDTINRLGQGQQKTWKTTKTTRQLKRYC